MGSELILDDWTAEMRNWYNSRPPVIQEAMREFRPDTCYKLKDTRGHYHLRSYIEPESEGYSVGITVCHLEDSWGCDPLTRTTIEVFDLTTDDLIHCGCKDNFKNQRG